MSSSSPSKPLSIRGRRGPADSEGASIQGSVPNGSGTPDLRLLRAQVSATPPPNIPLRTTTPLPRNGTPLNVPSPPVGSLSTTPQSIVGGISAARESASGTSTPALPAGIDDLPEEEKMKVLRRHLVSKEQRTQQKDDLQPPAESSGSTSSRRSSTPGEGMLREESEPFPIPYHAPGADVTHDIYKYHAKQRQQTARTRSASVVHAHTSEQHPAFEHIHEPGGFRRNYVLLRANEQGSEEPRILNNFIDFLFLFGHFAGEDLEEDEEDEEKEDEENLIAGPSSLLSPGLSDIGETEPLLGKATRSRSRRRQSSVGPHGNATVTQAVLMLLKAFIGTGVLFLGRAFYNGGILFSSILFVFIAAVSLYSFLLLVETKFVVSGSFGDIGGALFGPWMRNLILFSIVISQIGFCGAYMIFVAENLQAFVAGVSGCAKQIGIHWFILIQAALFLPLVLIRDLAKLSTTALIADGFILVGLVYIFGSEINIVSTRGIADVALFNPKDFALFVGTAVFSFEGIGLVIPITDSMKEPRKFPAVITGVMAGLVVLFGGAGALAYLTFGSEVQTVILVNLDTKSKMVQAVQFIYSLAILLSVPLQMFPAVRIMENGLFTRSGKADNRVKWLKNLFRWAVVLTTTIISWVGASDLDKFVAFIGCFACVPLCYVYPAMLHYKACAHTTSAKVKDILMIVFGTIAGVFTTVQTVRLMLEPAGGSPQFGSCDPL